MGDHAAAQETFAKVSGPREPIAKLWSAYANGQSSDAAAPAVADAGA